MIKTVSQLKSLVKNMTNATGCSHEVLYRNYMIERFLERVTLSKYKYNFILKGGILISSLVGNTNRSTMDLDSTIKGFSTETSNLQSILEEICNLDIGDNVEFMILDIEDIMEDAEYPCKRVNMKASLGRIVIPVKIDLSTGDAITPKEMEYKYNLLFEDRHIELLSYTIETVLAEKIESILSKSIANTRMRDFYDVYILYKTKYNDINFELLSLALRNTSSVRNSLDIIGYANDVVNELYNDKHMSGLWKNYQSRFDYAENIQWYDVINILEKLITKL